MNISVSVDGLDPLLDICDTMQLIDTVSHSTATKWDAWYLRAYKPKRSIMAYVPIGSFGSHQTRSHISPERT